MAIIKLDPLAGEAIKRTLLEKMLPLSVRIEIRSTGCCDASLGLVAETIESNDLVEEIEGLSIAIDPAIYKMIGNISISTINDSDREGFVVVSERPLNEWAGFGASTIRISSQS